MIGRPARVQAVLFDMDGTLLAPIDDGLPEFKDRWRIPRDRLVVPSLPSLPPEATEEFMQLERRVARDSTVRPGIPALLADLVAAGVGVALVTNNTTESANTVLTRHELVFPVVRAREDGPMKPAPDLVLSALEALGVPPAAAVFVGDTPPDVGAARAAGLPLCLLFAEPWNEHLSGDDLRRILTAADLRLALVAAGAPEALLASPDAS